MGQQPDEQTEQGGSQGQGVQGAMPLLVAAGAAAAAGAIAVLARKALAGGDGGDGDESGNAATPLDDVEKVADDLANLVDELRSEAASSGDLERLVEIADTISEYADQAASAFDERAGASEEDGEASTGRRVTDDLMSRVGEIIGTGGEQADTEKARSPEERAAA